ncbi:MAG: hypothetical protein AAGE90_19280 [Pseudomonadota bacterium]
MEMANIFSSPRKISMRDWLFTLAIEALESDGWKVEKIPGSGKSSIRRLSKGRTTKVATIRTSQDTWIAFPRTPDDSAWATLEDADVVVASSVDSKENPRFGQVHVIDAGEMRDRFDRLYEARRKAGHRMKVGRGIWTSLYEKETSDPVSHVGAGAGLDHPPLLRRKLIQTEELVPVPDSSPVNEPEAEVAVAPLTIAEAKRRLAMTFGIREEDVSITING